MLRTKGKEVFYNQGSDEWLEWRKKGIGSSDAAVIKLGNNFGTTPYDLWEEKLGLFKKIFSDKSTEAMHRGTRLEPEARELFIKQTGIVVEPCCFIHPTLTFMKASLDGMDIDREIGLEIKCPGESVYGKIQTSGIPDYYYAQIQHQFAVTGARVFFFWAYSPDSTPSSVLIPVYPDYAYIQDLIAREINFWQSLTMGIPPVDPYKSGVQSKQIGMLGLVLIAGYSNAGKKTAARLLGQEFRAGVYGFSDSLKKFCEDAGIRKTIINRSSRSLATEKADKEMLVKVGHTLRSAYADVWIKSLFDLRSQIFEAMKTYGAIVHGARYVNEYEYSRNEAQRLGVPFRMFWIQSKDEKPTDSELECTRHLYSISDCIIHNDSTEEALRKCLLYAVSSREKELKASDFV